MAHDYANTNNSVDKYVLYLTLKGSSTKYMSDLYSKDDDSDGDKQEKVESKKKKTTPRPSIGTQYM